MTHRRNRPAPAGAEGERISRAEIRASLRSRSPAPDPLLGCPNVEIVPFDDSITLVPLSQIDLARRRLAAVRSREAMEDRLRAEYRSVADALARAGARSSVLNLSYGDAALRDRLLSLGAREVRFAPDHPTRWQLFPRDLFVHLPRARVTLLNETIFRSPGGGASGHDRILSPYGEGGRVLHSGDLVLVGLHPERDPPSPLPPELGLLRERGLRVAFLPLPLVARMDRADGVVTSLEHDPHLDRSAALLRDREGLPFLLADPGFRTGTVTKPDSAADSRSRLARACETAGVELVMPSKLSVPMAAGAVDLGAGRVLVTGGDPEVASAVSGRLDAGAVIETDLPFAAYPVFAAAGLHCLVTESPSPLVVPRGAGLRAL